MAQLRLNPGHLVGNLLWDAENHRARKKFKGEQIQRLRARRHDEDFWRIYEANGMPVDVKSLVIQAGFGGPLFCGSHKIDPSLITTLVERWHSETHTFHLPVGEAIITLQDVQVLWALSIEGNAVTGDYSDIITLDENVTICQNLLGFSPTPDAFDGTRLKMKVLCEEITRPLRECNDQEEYIIRVQQRARVYILQLLGGTLCPDKSGACIALYWLKNLENFDQIRNYSWGSRVLANLYKNLCRATKPTF